MMTTVPPGRVRQGERITIPVRSSSGKNNRLVVLHEAGAACPGCPGFRFRGTCRHIAVSRAWLEAVIPPRELPS